MNPANMWQAANGRYVHPCKQCRKYMVERDRLHPGSLDCALMQVLLVWRWCSEKNGGDFAFSAGFQK